MLNIITLNRTESGQLRVCGLLNENGVLVNPDPTACTVPVDEVLCYTLELGNKCEETRTTVQYGNTADPLPQVGFSVTCPDQSGMTFDLTIPTGYTFVEGSATYCSNITETFTSVPTGTFQGYIDNQCNDITFTVTIKSDCGRLYEASWTPSFDGCPGASPITGTVTTTDVTPSYNPDSNGCVYFTGLDFGLGQETFTNGIYYVKVTMKYIYQSTVQEYSVLSAIAIWDDECDIQNQIADFISEGEYLLATHLRITYDAFLLSDGCAYEHSCTILERLNELMNYDADCGCIRK